MRIHLNNATVRVSGFENKKSFSHIYHNVTCIEDGKTATFSKKSKLDYEVL